MFESGTGRYRHTDDTAGSELQDRQTRGGGHHPDFSRKYLARERPETIERGEAGYAGRWRNPAAMLDVDGTLLASPTPLGVSFAEYLNEHTSDSPEGYGFDPAAMQQIEALMTDEDLTYVDRVEGVIDAYRNGIAGCRHRTVSRLARDFLDEINDTLPSQAQEAVEDLHTNGYEVALVSLNPTTVLREFRNVIGPGIIDEDNVYGLDFEVDGGVFTGRLMNNRPGFLRKKLAVEEMLSSNETTRDDSTAAGDTRYDLPMLNEVDYPAMISPSQPLKTMMDQRDAYIPSYDDISEYVQHVTEKDLGKQVPGMMGR